MPKVFISDVSIINCYQMKETYEKPDLSIVDLTTLIDVICCACSAGDDNPYQ